MNLVLSRRDRPASTPLKRFLLPGMPALAVLAMILLPAVSAVAGTVRVSAAASLTETVVDLARAYRAANSGDDIVPNFGGSGALAKQVEAGAPVDILLSASIEWLDYLKKRNLVARSIPLARNSLVFVGMPSTVASKMRDLPALSRIALGSPAAVPSGKYASEAMKAAGVAKSMEGKAVFTKDVRGALMYAERGEVDGAFVFKSDALAAKNAISLFDVPKSLYSDALVTFEDDRGAYDQKDAAGFIRLNALRLRTLAARDRKRS